MNKNMAPLQKMKKSLKQFAISNVLLLTGAVQVVAILSHTSQNSWQPSETVPGLFQPHWGAVSRLRECKLI